MSTRATVRLVPQTLGFRRWLSQQNYLSPAYRCDEAWNRRLEHPPVKSIKPTEFYYDIERKFRTASKVFALDTDLFVNKLTKDDMNNFLDEVDDVVQRLRKSPDTYIALPSTSYAVLRLFLDIDHRDKILKCITAPELYGIFPDDHMCNLLMDHFLSKQDFTACARIASSLMLQEDFGQPLTQRLAMLSCLRWVTTQENTEWVDYHPPPSEPEEEVQVRVAFLPLPYNDDHFQLKQPNHIIGKTILFGSSNFYGVANVSCRILGCAMFEKWDELNQMLQEILKSSDKVATFVMNKVEELLEGCHDKVKNEISLSLHKLRDTSMVTDVDLVELLEGLVKESVTGQQSQDIDSQIKSFQLWQRLREEELKRTIAEFERNRLLVEIEEKKKYVDKKEETIMFFDNEDKLKIMISDKKDFMEKEANAPANPHYQFKKKKINKNIGVEYIPPEITKKKPT